MGYGVSRNQENDGIAHNWAHQMPDAKTSNKPHNFFYEGPTIYSYGHHFPIACLHKKGKKVTVLFTTMNYSPSTTNHKWTVQQACSHLDKIYCLYPLDALNGKHERNLRVFEGEAKDAVELIGKARKPEKYFDIIERAHGEMRTYCKYFGLTKKNYPVLAELKAIYTKPSQKAIEDIKKHQAKEAEAENKKEAEKIEREREMAEARAIVAPKVIEAWRTRRHYVGRGLKGEGLKEGEMIVITNRGVSSFLEDYTILRTNTDKKVIETSKSVEIPFEVAEKFYKWLKHKRATGGCDGGCNYKILGYEVLGVNENSFTVGCHHILWPEAESIAKELGWAS